MATVPTAGPANRNTFMASEFACRDLTMNINGRVPTPNGSTTSANARDVALGTLTATTLPTRPIVRMGMYANMVTGCPILVCAVDREGAYPPDLPVEMSWVTWGR